AVKLTGKQIRDTLEHGVSAVEKKDGRFPQVSGITFVFDSKNPVGARLGEININGKPLTPDKEYVVATNDFIAAGGDGFKAFGEAVKSSKDYANIGGAIRAEKLVYNDSSKWIKDVVVNYIRETKEISPATEGRIKQGK
ncbi:MAG TPA: 5'-nucleotidase, partial [Syntrophorhabdaceae bacterium]|nr:5'-nucleotidase [Syntrophorhabdaceae bacterium]